MGASLELLLVRHGQDQDNARFLINGRRDTELTEIGKVQASDAAQALRSTAISRAYTSPLTRARQTASIIANMLGIAEPQVDSDLIERDYGILTGRPASEIPIHATRFIESYGFKYVIEAPGMESYAEVWQRAGSFLQRISTQHGGETVLVVAHNDIAKMIRANFSGAPWEDELRRPPLANGEIIALR
jgi:broad specificity phosphatase PhoE